MAIAENVGYDRRGKTIYRRNEDGIDIVEDIQIAVAEDGQPRISKERIVANDLPGIVDDYSGFRQKVREGKVFFDKSEGAYRAID